MSVVKSKKKKVVVLGFPNPIRMRDKSYVLQKIYDKAKTKREKIFNKTSLKQI